MPVSNSPSAVPTLSAEVKNILDAPPVWLVRWGSMLLLGGILVLLTAAGFVRYPHVITGPVALYAGHQVTVVPLPAGATEYSRRVQPGQVVEAGQLLAIVRLGSGERGLLAPTAGTIEVRTTPAGQELLQLRPTAQSQGSTVTLAEALGPQVRVGQRVLISLSAFPSDKFGQLTGRVVQAARPAGPGQVTVAIALDQGYRSTHGQQLPLTGVSQGTAQIITTDQYVLERLLRL